MTQKVISQTPLNSAQLHAEMKRIKARDETLGFRAQKTIDYLDSLNVIDEAKAKELYDALVKLDVPRLRDVHFHKLIDLMPRSAKDVKTVLQGYNMTVSQESCQKIAETIAQFVK